MSIEKVNQWLMLAANVGVLAGIFFLGMELQQNTNMMKAQTRDAVAGKLTDWFHEMTADPRKVEILASGNAGFDELTDIGDRFTYRFIVQSTIRLWENEWYQYQIGLYDENEFMPRMLNWEDIMRSQGYRDIWLSVREFHSESFRELMDGFVARYSQE